MKLIIIVNRLTILFCFISVPYFLFAAVGTPSGRIQIHYPELNQMPGDTTVPAKDPKTVEKKEENAGENNPAQVVKVIPKARRQPIPVPVKVNVQPVKIITPKIIKPVIKPVIKLIH